MSKKNLMKRLFIALAVSKEIKRKVALVQKDLENLPVRLIKKKNLHITVVPPFYRENDEDVIKNLEQIKLNIKPFSLKFEKIDLWPNQKKPKCICVYIQTSKEAQKLKKKLEKNLNLKTEKRDFTPHLTIAKFKETTKSLPSEKKQELTRKVDWRERVKSYSLMQSKLSRKGADYTTLAEISLLQLDPDAHGT